MKEKHLQISEEVKAVLNRSEITGNTLKIIEQLDRKLYVLVNKVLELAGGKWNKKAKAHIFESDPREILQFAVENGKILDGKRTFQMFFTPPALATRMVQLAKIKSHHRVLEPSAGIGNILKAIGDQPDKVAIEINPDLVEALIKTGLSGLHIYQADFLSCNGSLGKFDRVVMNPPFSNGEDIKHIRHALTMLKTGGRLVALCANGPRQVEAFKDKADYWEELRPGSFKEAGTEVNVALLVLTT